MLSVARLNPTDFRLPNTSLCCDGLCKRTTHGRCFFQNFPVPGNVHPGRPGTFQPRWLCQRPSLFVTRFSQVPFSSPVLDCFAIVMYSLYPYLPAGLLPPGSELSCLCCGLAAQSCGILLCWVVLQIRFYWWLMEYGSWLLLPSILLPCCILECNFISGKLEYLLNICFLFSACPKYSGWSDQGYFEHYSEKSSLCPAFCSCYITHASPLPQTVNLICKWYQ